MIHNTNSDLVLEYIRKHPGLLRDRIDNAFRKSVSSTIKKLEIMGKLEGVPTTPFVKKKKKVYYAT